MTPSSSLLKMATAVAMMTVRLCGGLARFLTFHRDVGRHVRHFHLTEPALDGDGQHDRCRFSLTHVLGNPARGLLRHHLGDQSRWPWERCLPSSGVPSLDGDRGHPYNIEKEMMRASASGLRRDRFTPLRAASARTPCPTWKGRIRASDPSCGR